VENMTAERAWTFNEVCFQYHSHWLPQNPVLCRPENGGSSFNFVLLIFIAKGTNEWKGNDKL
jgi:hypothetical protein